MRPYSRNTKVHATNLRAAGELGVCQVRKAWLTDPDFKKEFKNAIMADFLVPSRNFMFAAWLLNKLKSVKPKTGGLAPWWSFYNSVHFNNRYNYYVSVKQHLARLRKFDEGHKVKESAPPETVADLFKEPKPAQFEEDMDSEPRVLSSVVVDDPKTKQQFNLVIKEESQPISRYENVAPKVIPVAWKPKPSDLKPAKRAAPTKEMLAKEIAPCRMGAPSGIPGLDELPQCPGNTSTEFVENVK